MSVPLPPHFALSLEHNGHRLRLITALDAVGEIDPALWVHPDEKRRAVEIDSVWEARIVSPQADAVHLLYAADLDILLAAMGSRPLPPPVSPPLFAPPPLDATALPV